MIISVSNGGVTLADPDNFKAFKVLVEDAGLSPEALAKALDGVATLDEAGQHAWVDEAALRKLGDKFGGPDWQESATGMIGYARKSGWVQEGTGAIRAHIERASA